MSTESAEQAKHERWQSGDYADLDPEFARQCWEADQEQARAQAKSKHKHGQTSGPKDGPQPPIELFWHGRDYNRAPRSWAVDKLIPETGHGLISGQWGTAKTFAALDLSASVMTGMPFAGRAVIRRGGVLFIAAEGASEIPPRLNGLVEHKLRPESIASGRPFPNIDCLPFAWIEECPSLNDDAGFNRLVETVRVAAQIMQDEFGQPLVLIIVDTLSASANFKDANDAAEGQFIMNRLGALSRATSSFALAVDHFGKAVETGTRGSSAKEASADLVLALLADRDTAGNVTNTRMAVRKLRGGATGAETPFQLKVVELGDDQTTCIIDWQTDVDSGAKADKQKARWPQSLRVFKAAMSTSLVEDGALMRPFGSEGPQVRAVPERAVRAEFVARWPADGDAEKKADAKRQAFNRAIKAAIERELIAAREIGGVDHLWFVDKQD